jgi:hypothetical protein
MTQGEIKLGGRIFQVVNYDDVSVLNEHYIMSLMRATGLDCVMPLAEGEESDQEYMIRLHAKLVDTLKLPDLLGGYLLPLGKTEADWTLDLAAETGKHIASCRDPADKDEVHRLGLLITMDFFRAGLASLKHSQSVLQTLAANRPSNASESPPTKRSTAAH